jgi:NADH-quinone oxidoreductase subunit K
VTAQALHLLLTVSAALFATGLFGLLVRRGILFQLVSIEVMLSGPALAFIAAGAWRGEATGQGMYVLILALAAAEAGLGLGLYLRLRRTVATADSAGDSDAVSELRG